MNKRKLENSTNIRNKKVKYIMNYYNIVIIQSFIRQFLSIKKYNILIDKISQDFNKIIKYKNESTLLGDNLENINKLYFYKYKENENYYFFDIRELYKHIENNKTNPYTNNIIPTKYIKQMYRIFNKLRDNGTKIYISNRIPRISRNNVYITGFIQTLNDNNIYTTVEQFNDLDSLDFLYIISTLMMYYTSDYNVVEIQDYFNNNTYTCCKLYTIDVIENIIYNNYENSQTLYIFVGNLIDSFTEDSE